jgi:hypothetical protein
MKHVSNRDRYKVQENIRRPGLYTPVYGIENHGTVGIVYIDQKTLTYHGGPSVNVDTKKLEGQEYKHLYKDKKLFSLTTNSLERSNSRLYVWKSV